MPIWIVPVFYGKSRRTGTVSKFQICLRGIKISRVRGILLTRLLIWFLGCRKVVLGTVLAGGAVLVLFKETIKGGNAGKTCLQGYFRNGQIRLCKKLLGHFDTSVTQVIAKCEVGILLEKSGEVELAETDGLSDGF